MRKKITIIEAMDVDIEVEKEKSIYVKHGMSYIMTDKAGNAEFTELMIKRAKREVDEYRHKYDNVLRGLCYWKSRALRA